MQGISRLQKRMGKFGEQSLYGLLLTTGQMKQKRGFGI
jgi:hypothetical protein